MNDGPYHSEICSADFAVNALGFLQEGKVDAICWSATPESRAREMRLHSNRRVIYMSCKHPDDQKALTNA